MYALDPAAVDMREAIAHFIERVILDSVDASPEQKASFVANTRENLVKWAAAPDSSLHLTATAGDELVGVVLVRDYWNLCHLFVAPEHQGRGLGRKLVEAALSACEHRSLRGVVRLNSSRNALGFYRHMAFIEVPDAPPHLRGVQLERRFEARGTTGHARGAEFMRFNAPDPVALASGIADKRIELSAAVQAGETLATVEAAADLASMLTTARMEAEALSVLAEHMHHAEANARHEPAGWFWNAYATALQYCGRRGEAEPYFIKAIELAKGSGWRRLQALALHHWGRSLVEQERFAEAASRISQALAIRVELNDPRQDSSRRALIELAALQALHPPAAG